MTTPQSALELFLQRLRERSTLRADEEQAILSLKGRAVVIDPHRDIVRPGELTDFCCLVLSGMAARFGQMRDGKRQITAVYIAGDMCDLYSLMLPRVEWALQALSAPLTIVKIPHNDLQPLVQASPAIAQALWRDCVADASILSQWVINVGRRDARMRTAHLFCELSIRMERAGLGSRTAFHLPVIQAQLADALGMTPVHLNRVMTTLRKENLLLMRGRDVHIPDWDGLADVGGFEGGYLELDQRWRMAG
jgi:CRP-like cAMP-binding protein